MDIVLDEDVPTITKPQRAAVRFMSEPDSDSDDDAVAHKKSVQIKSIAPSSVGASAAPVSRALIAPSSVGASATPVSTPGTNAASTATLATPHLTHEQLKYRRVTERNTNSMAPSTSRTDAPDIDDSLRRVSVILLQHIYRGEREALGSPSIGLIDSTTGSSPLLTGLSGALAPPPFSLASPMPATSSQQKPGLSKISSGVFDKHPLLGGGGGGGASSSVGGGGALPQTSALSSSSSSSSQRQQQQQQQQQQRPHTKSQQPAIGIYDDGADDDGADDDDDDDGDNDEAAIEERADGSQRCTPCCSSCRGARLSKLADSWTSGWYGICSRFCFRIRSSNVSCSARSCLCFASKDNTAGDGAYYLAAPEEVGGVHGGNATGASTPSRKARAYSKDSWDTSSSDDEETGRGKGKGVPATQLNPSILVSSSSSSAAAAAAASSSSSTQVGRKTMQGASINANEGLLIVGGSEDETTASGNESFSKKASAVPTLMRLYDEGVTADDFHEARYLRATWSLLQRGPSGSLALLGGGSGVQLRRLRYTFELPTSNEIFEFMRRLFSRAKLTAESGIISLVYIERLLDVTQRGLRVHNWRPIVMCGLLLASKVWDDLGSWSVEFSAIYPQYTTQAINTMERLFVSRIGFNLYISGSHYAKYYFALRAMNENKTFRKRYNNMVGAGVTAPIAVTKRIEESSKAASTLYSRSM